MFALAHYDSTEFGEVKEGGTDIGMSSGPILFVSKHGHILFKSWIKSDLNFCPDITYK